MRRILLVALLSVSGCALPRWPGAGTMTSAFGIRLDGWRPELHRGVDISMPIGSAVTAMRSGRVRFAGTMAGYGTVVILEHGEWTTVYAHLSELRTERGAQVKGGTVIGLSGRSGNATGPHLHFEILRSGRPEDPVMLLGGPPPRR